MSFHALILAGSRGGADPVADYAGVPAKALITIGTSTMLARVVEALRAAGAARIGVSVSDPAVAEHAATLGVEVLTAEAGPSASARSGLAALGTPLLVTTADHALLEPEWITAFLEATPAGADVTALLARRDVIEAAVPDTQRTYLRFADGSWSGCNLFYLATAKANAALDLWSQVEADRKRPWRIVRRLGTGTLLRYLMGWLTLDQALTRLGAAAGISARAVASPFGLAAVDVDKPADLDLVRRLTD
ncbi:nucleotidyltransferase family protein [Sphingomonas sp. 3-13AW]|jgi:GTP:adenosylcobinamide-phosphate guanylyltransferase|uniref:nucleotidyltransferase family protein n=1 Tax=Sphingomonas sp. 3-13AW TaxID=3050450 RepID=UPI003BB6D9A2